VGRDKLYSLAVVLTLGLGIGCNVAIFAVADALLNHPVDFPGQDRLISVMERKPQGTGTWSTVSGANYLDWQRRATTLEKTAAYAWWDANLTGSGEPVPVKGYRVSSDFFQLLGVSTEIGRLPRLQDGGQDLQTVVLSHGLWWRLFQGSEEVLGTTIRLNGLEYQIVGVMPDRFQFPAGGTDLWVPLTLEGVEATNRSYRNLSVVGRLKEGVRFEAAQAELAGIAAELAQENPETNRGWGVVVQPLHSLIVGDIQPFVILLQLVVAFVLLIACINVAILQLARSSGREVEFATRAAMGASRGRLIRQVLLESVALSLLGGAMSLGTGQLGVRLIQRGIPADLIKFLPGWSGVGLDNRAFTFALLISLFCGIVCGVVPALQLSRSSLISKLRSTGTAKSGKQRRRWREALVVSEIGLAVILLVGTGVMVDAFRSLLDASRSFRPDETLALHLVLPESRYRKAEEIVGFYSEVVARMKRSPAVESVAGTSYMPYAQLNGSTLYNTEEDRSEASQRSANLRSITPDLFQVLGIPLLRGRAFEERDRPEAPFVAIVSEKLALQCWGDQNPIGRRLRIANSSSPQEWVTVVGVVGDVRHSWLDRELRPTVYVPLTQAPQRRMDVLIRVAAGSPLRLAGDARRIVHDLDPGQPVNSLRTMGEAIDEVTSGLRFVVVLMAAASGVAFLLATIGIFSVTTFMAQERSAEMGVRVALGAAPNQVMVLMMGRGVHLMLVGLIVGVLGGTGLAQLLSGLVYGVEVVDVPVLLLVACLLGLSSLLAAYGPARSVAYSDPTLAMRGN
jgi:putative ABC transport system permease protein